MRQPNCRCVHTTDAFQLATTLTTYSSAVCKNDKGTTSKVIESIEYTTLIIQQLSACIIFSHDNSGMSNNFRRCEPIQWQPTAVKKKTKLFLTFNSNETH